MKIVFTCDTMGSGGAERVISNLSNAFVKKGHDVSIIMVSYGIKKSFYELNENISLIPLLADNNRSHLFKRAKLLKDTIVSKKPDIVLSFLSHVCIYTWWALRNTKIPYIVSERNDPNMHSIIKKILLKKAYKRSAGSVFQTDDAMKWYGNIVENKCKVIYNPVALSNVPLKEMVRQKKVLYVGRLEPQKNCFFLVEAFRRFHSIHNDYILKIIGDGSLKKDLCNYISSSGLIHCVNFVGINKDWQKTESDASMFLLTSDYEGMPNSLQEALCLGIPSVSTDCPIGGPKELQKLFPDYLFLSEVNNLDEYVQNMERCLTVKGVSPHIPNELQIDYIAEEWLSFIKGVI